MITIESDIESTQKALSKTSKSLKSIQRKTLSIVGKETLKALKSAISMTTTKRTGELLKAYKTTVKNDSVKVMLNYKKNGDKIFPKVYTLNYGKDGTQWRPRNFVQSAEQYVEKANYTKEIEKMIEKELNQYWS